MQIRNPLVADGGNPSRLKLASENISLSLCGQRKCETLRTSAVHIILFCDIKFSTTNNYLTVNCWLQENTAL